MKRVKNTYDMKAVLDYENLSSLVRRRLGFVFAELSSSDSKYDQSMSILLRVLSNFATIGADGSSYRIKCKNTRISIKADKLRDNLKDPKKWAAQTVNEHPMPLNNLWNVWKSKGGQLTEKEIWDDLIKHPMVTITKEEDAVLRGLGKQFEVNNIGDRYRLAGIELILSTK